MTGLVLPDLCTPTRGTRHTADSALATLEALGASRDQVGLASAGPGWPAGLVVWQSPCAGTRLTPGERVVLGVTRPGMAEAVPFPLRHDGDGMLADPIFSVFDPPLLALDHHLRAGGGRFALRPRDPETARRWVAELFGVDPSPWRPERWYSLARLLPVLHQLRGTEAGVRLALRLLWKLPVMEVRLVRAAVPLPADRRTRLGTSESRLGWDAVVGDGVVVRCGVQITLGPVELAAFREHSTPVMRAERDAAYRLLLPAELAAEAAVERWSVRGANAAGGPGAAPEMALGVNAYLNGKPTRP